MKKAIFLVFVPILLFGIKLNSRAQVLEGPPRDGVYDKTAIVQMLPIPYSPLREADVIWSKRLWRVIDMREKINQPFYFPTVPQNGWRSFITIIMDALKEGTIQAYSELSDQFLYPISYKELMDKMEQTKKVKLKRPDNPDIEFDTVITQQFNPSDVYKIRLKEDYFFDRQRSVMEVRILGICPMVNSYDEKGEYRGEKPLFWVYFPECRNILAKAEQFNLHNGSAARLSYDDVFMKRMFNSYVYKEENVYDRTINEYAAGVDALMESERAKNSLLEFEESLWEY
jgi:gliding motility associated protien GldN